MDGVKCQGEGGRMSCPSNLTPSSARSIQDAFVNIEASRGRWQKKKKRKLNGRTNPPTPPPLLDKRLSSGLVIGSFQMEMASGGAGEQVHPQRSKLQFTRRQEIKRGKGLGVCGWSKGGKRGGPESAISFFSTTPPPTSTTTTPSIL